MARAIGRLTALSVSRAKSKGIYADGGGLYLQVSAAGTKSWLFRYRMGGRKTPRDMGLGSLVDVSLADAREKARDARTLIDRGIDPIDAKRAMRANLALARASAVSFKEAARSYIDAHSKSWRNPKHKDQWPNTLEQYVYPSIGNLPVAAVDVNHIVKILEPIWPKKAETASRVRGRIESVLDWAKARGYRAGENPARWRGHLENLLPKRSKVRRVQHHPALPYVEIGAFMALLREQEGIVALAMQFLILTAARTSEVVGARWREIDIDKATWTVPADRIKAGKEHRVPLSPRAVAILKKIRPGKIDRDAYVFPGGRRGKPLSANAMLALLKRIDRTDLTVHGFRSSFRDWCAEQTNYPRDVAEMALAHAVSDQTEAAYRRGDMLDKRVLLMKDWGTYCGKVIKSGKSDNIVSIGNRRRTSSPAR